MCIFRFVFTHSDIAFACRQQSVKTLGGGRTPRDLASARKISWLPGAAFLTFSGAVCG